MNDFIEKQAAIIEHLKLRLAQEGECLTAAVRGIDERDAEIARLKEQLKNASK